MDNATKALALARLGLKVFPVNSETKRPAIPDGRGCYDGTLDVEMIATWFTLDYVGDGYAVAVWAGGSDVLALDIDQKNGKDGFAAIEGADLSVGSTYKYPTKNGGEHHIFASSNPDLTLGESVKVDGDRLDGVDIRAGGSYFVWWGDSVPESRDVFSTDIPEWVVNAATPSFTAPLGASAEGSMGFTGNVADWLEHVPGGDEPSYRVNEFMARIPKSDFGHTEMVDLVWGIVRLGSERNSGIKVALEKLRAEWLRDEYDTPKNRKDFYTALIGAISKAGRTQKPMPPAELFDKARAEAEKAGVWGNITRVEREVSETIKKAAEREFSAENALTSVSMEVEFTRARREIFTTAAKAGVSPSAALGIVCKSKAFTRSVASQESVWFGDGELPYHDYEEPEEADPDGNDGEPGDEGDLSDEEREIKQSADLSTLAEKFSFLSEEEREKIATDPAYRWWGDEYLEWVQSELPHFNKPYHIASMWAALSVIVGPWGKVPKAGADPLDCNLYFNVQGMSSSGKSEAWEFGTKLIDTYYGIADSPIIADASKATALSIHRALILRDGQPSLVYADEVQAFFRDLKKTHWQGSILGDMSNYYGGKVPPKHTMNDKEISGKRAKTKLTVYFTGIAQQTLDATDIGSWTDGLFLRFLWSFGYPRLPGTHKVKFKAKPTAGALATAAATGIPTRTKLDEWVDEFKVVQRVQEFKPGWGAVREVYWEDDAADRLDQFSEYMDTVTKTERLYSELFVSANGRFRDSIMKVATIIALLEGSEMVTLRAVLIALNYAGPWHRSMVLAVAETGKDSFRREADRCLEFISRNAIRQIGKRPYIQRSLIMRHFFPNEVGERLLRQLVEEGWIARTGDSYELVEER